MIVFQIVPRSKLFLLDDFCVYLTLGDVTLPEAAAPVPMTTGDMLQPLTAGMNHLSLSEKAKPTYQVCLSDQLLPSLVVLPCMYVCVITMAT